MAKTKDKSEKRRPAAEVKAEPANTGSWDRTVRETIESIVIAFVLAFLFRTFEAEAFVIPTGSMATTLMGRHLDVDCPKCHFRYQVGALRDEQDDMPDPRDSRREKSLDITECVCPQCRWVMDFAQMSQEERNRYPIYNGDRILVSKFAYDFADPKRWDVIVFKFPEDAKTNYIKRLVGLPNEVMRIREGDIAVTSDISKPFHMAPKDPAKMRAMLRLVYDNDYVYEPFLERGWPARWENSQMVGTAKWMNDKQSDGVDDPKVFATDGRRPDGKTPGEAWLRYYHYVPTSSDWQAFSRNESLDRHPQVSPITDFLAYDGGTNDMIGSDGPHSVVSDLAIECEAEIKAAEGRLTLELFKHGQKFQCQLDLTNGAVTMNIPGVPISQQPKSADGGISRAGTYRLLFANVDHQLTLMIGGHAVKFDKSTAYAVPSGAEPSQPLNGEYGEFSPAGIDSIGAAVRLSHLRMWRDIYYTYIPADRTERPEYDASTVSPSWPQSNRWFCFPKEAASKLAAANVEVRPDDQYFFIGPDQFVPLGDNSPKSADARIWPNQHFVDRQLLVGKALFIYWPHSFDRIQFSDDKSIPFPFFPNFSRMGFVH